MLRSGPALLVLLLGVHVPATAPWLVAQSAPARPRITGIHHVAFRVTAVAAARMFYGSTLGLHERPGSGPLVFAVGPHQHLRVAADLPPGGEERLDHLAFTTPDLDALASHLRSAGIAFTPADCAARAIRLRDPDGHTIEFVTAPWPPAAGDAEVARGAAPLSARILHAGLTIRDEAAATAFYGKVLGFSEIWRGGRTDAATDWVNMRVPDGTDYLEYMLVAAPPDRRQRGVLHHVCLLVPDIQAAFEEVGRRTPAERRAALGSPNVGRNGRWQLNLYDAEGTRTELMEPFRVR